MNNTALSAKVQSTKDYKESITDSNYSYDSIHMVFADGEHEKFYYEKVKQVLYQDCYHKALFYLLEITENTRNHFSQIYDSQTDCIKIGCLRENWQTSGSSKIIRLAWNLYTNRTPSIDNYKRKREQIEECRKYSVNDIFCCDYARYFWEGIRLRYPEYCCKQKSTEEILAEVKERKCAKNSINGNEE